MTLIVVTLTALICLLPPLKAEVKDCRERWVCQDHEACVNNKCEDLRFWCDTPTLCGVNASCVATDHRVTCLCKPGVAATEQYPCVNNLVKLPSGLKEQDTITYIKSEYQSVEMQGIAQLGFYLSKKDMSFTIKTQDLGIEPIKLHCFITPGERFKVAVELQELSNSGEYMMNMTQTYRGQTQSGWFELPLSTDDKELYLKPHSEYRIRVNYRDPFYFRRFNTPRMDFKHFILQDFQICYYGQYCSPMIYLAYKTLTPQ